MKLQGTGFAYDHFELHLYCSISFNGFMLTALGFKPSLEYKEEIDDITTIPVAVIISFLFFFPN